MFKEPKIYSSYRQNHLGKTLYDLILKLKPKKIIEFGVLYGYSTISMAEAVRDLGQGRILGYDLFEDYPYRHVPMEKTIENIKKYQVERFIDLEKKDFYQWVKNPEGFNLLHLDISNDGYIIKLAYRNLKKFIDKGSVIVFEGGIKERDKVDWMIRYKKAPIYPLKALIGYTILNPNFPGLSLISQSAKK